MLTQRHELDEMLEILCDRRRRRVLVALLKRTADTQARGTVGLGEVVETDSERAQMVHCHLPKLDETGYVNWNRNEATVSTGPEWDALESLLRAIIEHRRELPGDLT